MQLIKFGVLSVNLGLSSGTDHEGSTITLVSFVLVAGLCSPLAESIRSSSEGRPDSTSFLALLIENVQWKSVLS